MTVLFSSCFRPCFFSPLARTRHIQPPPPPTHTHTHTHACPHQLEKIRQTVMTVIMMTDDSDENDRQLMNKYKIHVVNSRLVCVCVWGGGGCL